MPIPDFLVTLLTFARSVSSTYGRQRGNRQGPAVPAAAAEAAAAEAGVVSTDEDVDVVADDNRKLPSQVSDHLFGIAVLFRICFEYYRTIWIWLLRWMIILWRA